ncbi:hypothetical protein ACOMHN_005951 [Nucella lapillus]
MRVLLVVLMCGTLLFWTINVMDWTRMDDVKHPSHKIRLYPKSAEKDGGVGSRRSFFKLQDGGLKRDWWSKNTARSNYSVEKHPWMFPRALSELEKKAVPNQVFFVWCHNRTFTFNDYLSVLSAWKLLEPDILEIHRYAEVKTDHYNQWFEELNRTIPFFIDKLVKKRKKSICGNPLYYALEVLHERGGMFMNFSTVLLRSVHRLREQEFSLRLTEEGDVSFIMSKIESIEVRRVLKRPDLGVSQMITMLKKSTSHAELCASVSRSLPLVFSGKETKRLCVTLPSGVILQPLTLHQTENQDLTIVRDMYYLKLQKETRCRDLHGQLAEIPFIVHYVWFGATEFSFRMYLSFLSTIHVAKAEKVYIHSDNDLRGHYWTVVSSHPQVTVVYREAPRRIYGHPVMYRQHLSDVVRADVLDKYGGIYLDWDVLWLRSPARLLAAGHEAVVNLDHMPRPDFPEVLNLGVFLARPRARFVRLWRWELRNYRSMDFFYNALELPFKVYERHPDTVHVEKRLQVMCFWLKCHPIFHPDHKNWNVEQPFNWRTDAFAIHFTHPDPEEYTSLDQLLNATGTFADIGKFIMTLSAP